MTNPYGLSTAILESIVSVFQRHPEIEQVKLYGSRAKGTYHERSDIDLVVYGHAINRHLLASLLMEFDESNIPYHVDLQHYEQVKNPALKDHMDRVGKTIFGQAKVARQKG